jgi:ubiquinone/menaquinone biosynthesis C-methylase UbiE
MTEWNQILQKEWYSRKEPDKDLIAFVASMQKQSKKLRVLDLGCGAGRHQIYLAKKGFESCGLDISATGLIMVKARLRAYGLDVCLVEADMKALPWIDSCFDVVVCLHAIYHQRLRGIQKTITEIQRILRENGLVYVNFLSTRTYSCGKGVKVEENTYMENYGDEKGVLHHFVGREEIERLFVGFRMVELKQSDEEFEGKLRSRWIVTAVMV